jgi:large repetitive protein
MADFRKWFYALAVVALLAGLTVPASAQTTAPPFQCVANAGVPPIVRGEGYAELVGDITLNCTGGVPTPAGQVVPQVNFTILLNTNITSKLLAGTFDEALLIVDEPHSAVNPTRDILNCGAAGASDTGLSGPGVCSIISDGNPVDTYAGDGTCVAPGTTGAYGCGHPNVFQGREGTLQNPGQYNAVTFLGVPLDPPGTTTNRTIRFTNIRADAKFLGVSSTFTTNYIQAQISVNGNTSLSINNPQQIVAYVQLGLVSSIQKSNFTFLQCVSENPTAFANGVGTDLSNTGGTPTYRFTEGFASSFKAKNISYITDQAGNGVIPTGSSYWVYNGTTLAPADQNQNVPGAIYNTESGFVYKSTLSDPSPNPPNGVGTVPVTSTANPFSSTSTGISGAGIATQGTRLAAQLTNIPQGSIVLVPEVVYLHNDSSTNPTGVMVLTSTDSNGAGAYSPYATAPSADNYVQVQSSGLIVYEVLFADPFSIEHADVPMVVAYASNLSQNLPSPGVTAQVAGSFAPFYSTASAHNPSSILPVPRFAPNLVPVNLYSVSKCACNLLFPYVASAAGYDSGIAIANTSLDPGASVLGVGANPQNGTVEFWYYGEGPNGGAPPNPQCTNTDSPGTCPGTTVVPAGQVLTYVLSSGSQAWGLDNRAAGFVGYIIAQAQFQYCHAFAYISALGAGPLTPGTSEGYLGLILDLGGLNRTNQRSENLEH